MGKSLSFLLVRRDDLVALGVSCANCVVDAGGLRAAGPPATLTLTFQPQSLAETKVDGASIQGGILSGVSTIAFELPPGTRVPLTAEGLLAAIASLPVTPGASAIELPFGVLMSPEDGAGGAARVRHRAQPLASSAGVHGLWQLAVEAPALHLRPVGVKGGDEDEGFRPLVPGERGAIRATGAAADVDRLRLSALGSTLTAHLVGDALRWDHDTALGRDQRVWLERSGVLYRSATRQRSSRPRSGSSTAPPTCTERRRCVWRIRCWCSPKTGRASRASSRSTRSRS